MLTPTPITIPAEAESKGIPRDRLTQPLLIKNILSIGAPSWQSTWCLPYTTNLEICRNFSTDLFVQWIADRFCQVFKHATKTVQTVSFVERVTESWQLSQETQCRPCDFQHRGCTARGYGDRGIAFNAGEHGHFSKECSRLQLIDLTLTTAWIIDEDVEKSVHADVEGVSTPLSLPHDLFAGLIGKQTHIWANPFPVTVVAPAHDYFDVACILSLSVLFIEQLGGEFELLDCLSERFLIHDFLRHVGFILLKLGKINK